VVVLANVGGKKTLCGVVLKTLCGVVPLVTARALGAMLWVVAAVRSGAGVEAEGEKENVGER
jgi:hypothetical protein